MVIPLPVSEPTVVGADMLLPLCDKPALVESLVGSDVVVGFAVGGSKGVDVGVSVGALVGSLLGVLFPLRSASSSALPNLFDFRRSKVCQSQAEDAGDNRKDCSASTDRTGRRTIHRTSLCLAPLTNDSTAFIQVPLSGWLCRLAEYSYTNM